MTLSVIALDQALPRYAFTIEHDNAQAAGPVDVDIGAVRFTIEFSGDV